MNITGSESLVAVTKNSVFIGCIVLITTYAVFKVWKGMAIRSKLPRFPGSYYPIVGNYQYKIRGEQGLEFKLLKSQRENNSDAITISLPSFNTYNVIITDFKLAKDCFVKHGAHSSGRVFSLMDKYSYFLEKFFMPRYSIGLSSGRYWHDTRRKAFGSLRELGVGKNRLEELVNIECEYLLEGIASIQAASNKDDLNHLFATATTNVICQLCFGLRFPYDNPEFKRLYHSINVFTSGTIITNIQIFLPQFLRRFPLIYNQEVEDFVSAVANIRKFTKKHVKSQQTHLRKDANDFEITQEDCLLKTFVKDFQQNPNIKAEDMMTSVMFDMFLAGTDTTSTALLWAVYFLRNHPDIQKLLKTEISENMTSERIEYSDMKNLPLCHAFLLESLRFGTIAPTVIPHLVTDAFSSNGYTFPKGTIIDVSIFCMNRDRKIFKNPDTFDINNFLNNGNVEIPDGFMPFGIGPRICFGERIARIEAFVFLANIIKNFTFSLRNKTDSIDDDKAMLGLARSPPSFNMNIQKA